MENCMDNSYEEETKSDYFDSAIRIIDFTTALICIALFSPLFVICYFAVKLEDGGPAIFKQERIGQYGIPFNIYKFRSMKLNAEKKGPQLYNQEKDTRLTHVGKFIREHHLDELPQLWNVIRGDMAFIGPRPERRYYIEKIMEIDPNYTEIYKVKPGVTSYSTLYLGYTDTIEKMVKRLHCDLYYIKHKSFTLNTKILVLTFLHIIDGHKF